MLGKGTTVLSDRDEGCHAGNKTGGSIHQAATEGEGYHSYNGHAEGSVHYKST